MSGDFTSYHWSRTTNLPSASAWTMMGWFRRLTNTGYWRGFFGYGNSGSNGAGLGTANGGTTLEIFYNGGSESTGSTLTVDAWNHLALTYDASYARCYLNGSLNITSGGTVTSPAAYMYIGADPTGSYVSGDLCAFKVWGATLTAAEIANEMQTIRPVRAANLNEWWPFTVDDAERSGTGYSWTKSGSSSYVNDAPVGWGASPLLMGAPPPAVIDPFSQPHSGVAPWSSIWRQGRV